MKSIAALLLTIALALFPLAGSRAMASVGGPAHTHAAAGSDNHHDHAAVHHHGQSDGQKATADVHLHAAVDEHGQPDASKNPCAGDHASSSCCSLSCHAMAPHVGVSVPAQMHLPMLVSLVALPLPRGVGFDGLLRPPRQA